MDQAILALAIEPRPVGYKPVEDAPRGTYRMKVGRYRMIYIILDVEQTSIVTRIRK
jgi:mRNA-degrading endonuclease RelE of RelBE toxin-antitoxin system